MLREQCSPLRIPAGAALGTLPDLAPGHELGLLLLLEQRGSGGEVFRRRVGEECSLSLSLSLSFSAADVASPRKLRPLSAFSQLEKERQETHHHPLSFPLPATPPHPTTTGPHGRRRPEEEPEHFWGHHQRRGAPGEAGWSRFFFRLVFLFFKFFEKKRLSLSL